jgi:hypothetical protein
VGRVAQDPSLRAFTTMGCGASSAQTVLETHIVAPAASDREGDVGKPAPLGGDETTGCRGLIRLRSPVAGPRKERVQPMHTAKDPDQRGTSCSSRASDADLSAAGTSNCSLGLSADTMACDLQHDVMVPASRICNENLVTPPEVLWEFFSGEVLASCETEHSSLTAECPNGHWAACGQPAAHCRGALLPERCDGLIHAGNSANWPMDTGMCGDDECIPWCLATRLRRHQHSCPNDEFQIMLSDLRAAAAADARLAELQDLLCSMRCLPASRPSQGHLKGQQSPAQIQMDSIDHGWRDLGTPPLDVMRNRECSAASALSERRGDECSASSSPLGPIAQLVGSPAGKLVESECWGDGSSDGCQKAAGPCTVRASWVEEPSASSARRAMPLNHPPGPR